MILSKFAIGLTLATGAAAVAGGTGPTPDGDVVVEPSSLIAGPSIMILGAFMPFVLYRLIPVFEGAAVGQGIASGPGAAAAQPPPRHPSAVRTGTSGEATAPARARVSSPRSPGGPHTPPSA